MYWKTLNKRGVQFRGGKLFSITSKYQFCKWVHTINDSNLNFKKTQFKLNLDPSHTSEGF